MNLNKINPWLTLLANFGVIAGIVFLAVEIGQNSEMMRAQTRTQLAEELTELFSANMNDQHYAEILLKGNNGQELTDVEQYQYFRHRTAWTSYWNNVIYQYQIGLYDEQEFVRQITAIRISIDAWPGIKKHWCTDRSRSPELIAAIEGEDLGKFC